MTSRRNRLVAAVLGTLVLGATAAMQHSAHADTTIVLNESNFRAHGWNGSVTGGPDDFPLPGEGTGPSVGLAVGPATPPAGVASYHFETYDTDDSISVYTTNYDGLAPAGLTTLKYSTYRFSDSTSDPAIYPALNVRIVRENELGLVQTVTTLVWEPAYWTLNPALPVNAWQEWDTLNTQVTVKGWWSTADQSTCGQSSAASCTWAQAIATLPAGSYIDRIGVKAGSGWDGLTHAAFDKIVIGTGSGTTTFDWETQFVPPPPPPPPPADRLPVKISLANATFDAFNNGTYNATVTYDPTPDDDSDADLPLAGAFVRIYVDTDNNPSDGFERLDCAGTTAADGTMSCSPARPLLPRLQSTAAKIQAWTDGNDTYLPGDGRADATYHGLDLL